MEPTINALKNHDDISDSKLTFDREPAKYSDIR